MPKGWLQVETGFQYQISDIDPSGMLSSGLKSEDFLYNIILLRYALTNLLEVRLTQSLIGDKAKQNGEITNQPDVSFSPTTLGVKYNFIHFKDGGQRLSLLANYTPSFSSDSEDYLELLFLFSFSYFEKLWP